MVDGHVISQRGYPSRDQLSAKAGLVPVGSPLPLTGSVGCGCGPKGFC